MSSDKPQAVWDTECGPNYWLIKFMRLSDNVMAEFEQLEDKPLDYKKIREIINKYELIDFNGIKYDVPMLQFALAGATNTRLKEISDKLIVEHTPEWKLKGEYKTVPLNIDHIDLIDLPRGKDSLKTYAGRLHVEELQDLPEEMFNRVLTRDEMNAVATYCGKDLKATALLYNHILPQIDLRRTMSKRYNTDLRSKSDAQIAEIILTLNLTKELGYKPCKALTVEKEFKYDIPEFITLDHEVLDIISGCNFTLDKLGHIVMPPELDNYEIKIGKSIYRLGIGGLHSSESSVWYKAEDGWGLADHDVTGYYPATILRCGISPKHIGPAFLKVFKTSVDERTVAKSTNDTEVADTLKIVNNGSFGKLSSKYSILYEPKLMLQVTLTGQLLLLMQINSLEEHGLQVVSANTDGIVVRYPLSLETVLTRCIKEWEQITRLSMERSEYSALYSRDVNNYFAIKKNGKIKTKGCFGPPAVSNLEAKNPQDEICNDALFAYVQHGTPFEQTIRECKDIRKFLTLRKVEGGPVKDGVYLGKIIRWYYGKNANGAIKYQSNGNNVALTDGAQPLMALPVDFPKDIDYNRYLGKCESLLYDVGLKHSFNPQCKFGNTSSKLIKLF